MSKPVKSLQIKSYQKRFKNVDGAVLINIRSLKSSDSNVLRAKLASKKIKISVVKNSLAREAFKGTTFEIFKEVLSGPCSMVYGGESVVSVARELIEILKGNESVEFKGAVMEGILFKPNEIDALSKYPTKVEAQAQVITLVVSPARNLVGQLLGPGRTIGGIVKAIEAKKEKEAPAAEAAPAA